MPCKTKPTDQKIAIKCYLISLLNNKVPKNINMMPRKMLINRRRAMCNLMNSTLWPEDTIMKMAGFTPVT